MKFEKYVITFKNSGLKFYYKGGPGASAFNSWATNIDDAYQFSSLSAAIETRGRIKNPYGKVALSIKTHIIDKPISDYLSVPWKPIK